MLKSTYVVAPNSDPSAIRWRYKGAKDVSVDGSGNLIIQLAPPPGRNKEDRSLAEQAPVAWQEINGQRVTVGVQYAVEPNGSVGFAVGQYNSAYALTIDPVLTFSTYLGGIGTEEAYGIAVDSSQNIYVAGYTRSTDFPLNNPIDSSVLNDYDAFITKFANGVRVYSTFLGGSDYDSVEGIAVDASNRMYLAGYTASTNFPIVNGYDATFNSTVGDDIFVARLSASGSAIDYSTYLGGSGNNSADDIALNGTIAYITGQVGASGFPTKNAYDTSYNGGTYDAIVAGFDTSLSGSSSLLMSSFLGGSNNELGYDIAYESGSLYIVGQTQSTNFPTKNPYDSSANGSADVFITKLSATTSGSTALQYSSYLGGSSSDQATAVAVKSGVAYMTGFTQSSGFPTKLANPVKDVNGNTIYNGSTYNGSTDAFVAAVNTTTSGSSSLLYSTFLGGSAYDEGRGIAIESDGRVTIAGSTTSTNFTTFGHYPMAGSNSGGYDVFLAKFLAPPSSGTLQIFNSGYLGGSDADNAFDLAVDTDGRAYIAGETWSTNFPMVNPQQGTYSGQYDVFVAKVFPEYWSYNTPTCRWAHTPGTTTTLTYSYASHPDLEPGDPLRSMYEQAVANWNNTATHMRFSPIVSGGLISFELYNDPNDTAAARTPIQCNSSTGTMLSAQVRGNQAYSLSAGIFTHELGHAQALFHISSYTEAILGSNRTGISTPQALDIELSNFVYP